MDGSGDDRTSTAVSLDTVATLSPKTEKGHKRLQEDEVFGMSDMVDADLFQVLERAIVANPWCDINFWKGGALRDPCGGNEVSTGKLTAANSFTQKLILKAIEEAEGQGETHR